MKPLNRKQEWQQFSEQVTKHIEQYTIPQYQNSDDFADQVGAWTSQECITAIKRYVHRYGKNLRGNKEALRDMLKIAHYAQFAYDKLKQELDEGDVYK